jgi:hypothetical protein
MPLKIFLNKDNDAKIGGFGAAIKLYESLQVKPIEEPIS